MQDQEEEREQAMLACGQRLGAYMGSMQQLQESVADKHRQIESQRWVRMEIVWYCDGCKSGEQSARLGTM